MKAYALALLLLAMPVGATVYDFHGTCTVFCTGDAYAEFLLDDSYVPGAQIDCAYNLKCPLLRIHYVDSESIFDYNYTSGTFTEGPSGFIQFPVVSGPALAGMGLFTTMRDDSPWYTHPDGTWTTFNRSNTLTQGIDGVYTLAAHNFTPEPATWALLLPALAGLRRKFASPALSSGTRSPSVS